MPENAETYPINSSHYAPVSEVAVAPVWHTVVLIAGIVALSIQGARQLSGGQPPVNRLQTYTTTAITELCMVGWIYFGLRLRRVPLRSLVGDMRGGFRSIAVDAFFAVVFWIVSLMTLGTIGVFWTTIEAAITHRSLFPNAKQLAPDASQLHTLHTLTQLAPTDQVEIIAWIVLCVIAGFAEELIFRGYLHRQFTAWARGTVAVGVVCSALLFGAAHGYQGARNMVLLVVFGALFSVLALLRSSLRPGMFAHSWHDLFTGLTLALLKAHHIV